jgi:UDP-glucose 4-epimerase
MKILVTGGAGFIGSHTCVELLLNGHRVVIYDNLSNSDREVINRIETITGVQPGFVEGDIRNQDALTAALQQHKCEAVIHFAGLKSVAESVVDPTAYCDNNVVGTLRLVLAMQEAGVRKLVFSSSATVYGEPVALPISEDHPRKPSSPYGRTKMTIEDMLVDVTTSSKPLNVAILRYFNPVGAHESGLMGEDPQGVPSNLMPFISQVAVGRRPYLQIFGNDYPTHDGTCVRDYVHVMDLATGHLRALDALATSRQITVNLGTGKGSSVLEMVQAFEDASRQKIAIQMVQRREGDVARYFASPALATAELNWRAERSLADMCRDAWRWQNRNPAGYRGLSR